MLCVKKRKRWGHAARGTWLPDLVINRGYFALVSMGESAGSGKSDSGEQERARRGAVGY